MPFTTLATPENVSKTSDALTTNGFKPMVLSDRAAALAAIKELIPAGASVMNGSSRTLEEIGFIEYLKEGKHGWNNLHAGVLAETDPVKKATLRKSAVISDVYLGSVHALSETGEMVIASASGSQLPHLAFTSPNVILVVSTQKITPSLTDALERVEKHVFPLEDARMKSVGMGGSLMGKVLLLKKELAVMGRSVHVLLVNEALGF